MKRTMMIAGMGLVLISCAFCTANEGEQAATELAGDKEKLSYAFGMNIAESLEHLRQDIELELLIQGIRDVLGENEPLLTFNEAGDIIGQYSAKRREEGERQRQEQGGKNLEAAREFLAQNAQREGVVTTDSGLQYEVLEEGSGPKPSATDRVRVHYHGTFIDGTVFDSSVERGEPIDFELNRTIPGWIEGLQLMSVGSKYKFFIPPNIAYGETAPPNIGPNRLLIFEVELLDIVD